MTRELSKPEQAVLDVLDEEIGKLEEALKKVQPHIDRLNKLKQTRRVLLNESGQTGGGGRSGVSLTQEEVILVLKDGPKTPAEIAEVLGHNNATVVRSHLHRGKDTRYKQVGSGKWALTEDDAEED